ncbi:hypothetical protein BC828DRAFT_416219 [Blastocladiella britannica]|nr:hypothetical protein BC828DRAFT_416219 [Blastocladiella britannica]
MTLQLRNPTHLTELEIAPGLVVHPGDHVRYHVLGTSTSPTSETMGVIVHIITRHKHLRGCTRTSDKVLGIADDPKLVIRNDKTHLLHAHSNNQIMGLVEEGAESSPSLSTATAAAADAAAHAASEREAENRTTPTAHAVHGSTQAHDRDVTGVQDIE